MKQLYKALQSALDEWSRVAPLGRCYLAFLPEGEELRVLREADPVPDGWQLVTGEAMPRNTDQTGCRHWMVNLCRRLPILKKEQS